MIVMNFLRGGQMASKGIRRLVMQASFEEQERLRTFALDHSLHGLLAAIKHGAESARASASPRLPGRRRAQFIAWDVARATAFNSDAIASRPVSAHRQLLPCSCASTGHGL